MFGEKLSMKGKRSFTENRQILPMKTKLNN